MSVGRVTIHAGTGELIAAEDWRPSASVKGYALEADPRTPNTFEFENLPAAPASNEVHFTEHFALDCPSPGWRTWQLSRPDRITVLDFNGGDGSAGTKIDSITVHGCISEDAPPRFLAATFGNEGLKAQDLYVKTLRALEAIDPLMGGTVTHGASHPYSWDHHEDVPEIAHRSPLALIVNAAPSVCDDHVGCYFSVWVSEADSASLRLPNPHPLVFVCRDAEGRAVSCNSSNVRSREQFVSFIAIHAQHPFHTRTLFHELGHYYDAFCTHGVLNESLREIVAQLFNLYLHRKLYPGLAYDLSTLPAGLECNLGALISHSAGRVVHPDCISDLDDIATEIDVGSDGYSIQSFTQAYWSLLNGVRASVVGGDLTLERERRRPADYEDRWMEALLFALRVSNDLNYVSLWNYMALFIQINYPADHDFMTSVRQLHGLQ